MNLSWFTLLLFETSQVVQVFWCIKTIFCVNFRGGQHPKLTHTLNNQGFWSLLIWVFQLLGVKVPDLSGTNGWSAKKIPIFLNDPPRKMNMSFLGTISTTGKGSSSSTIVFQGPSKSWEENCDPCWWPSNPPEVGMAVVYHVNIEVIKVPNYCMR